MMKFDARRIPRENLTIISAYVSDLALLEQGKRFLHETLAELVRQSITVHRIEIENIVTEFMMSRETKKYIEDKIRESIDKIIQSEVSEIFKGETE